MKLFKLLFLLIVAGCGHGSDAVPTTLYIETTTTSSTTTSTTTSTTVLDRSTLPLPTTTTTTTLPKEPLVVVAVGDIVCSSSSGAACLHEEVAQVVSDINPDIILALGDLQYENGSYNAFMNNYDKSWGVFKDITYPVPGNHEYYSNAQGYAEYFNLESFYYSFDMDGWHFVALDSEFISEEQLLWLDEDLESNSLDCTIAFWHTPRFSSGVHGNNSRINVFWDMLPDGAIVLSGHDHHYERFNYIDEKVQYVIGTGGKSMRSVDSVEDSSAFVNDDFAGVLVFTLYEGRYTHKFIGVDGQELDYGFGRC